MQIKASHLVKMTHTYLPGKQGLACWHVSRRKFCGSWQPAQFSIRDWSRLMSACWLAMSCWSFLIKAIKSLMPRNTFSVKWFDLKTNCTLNNETHRTIAIAMHNRNIASTRRCVDRIVSKIVSFTLTIIIVYIPLSVLLGAWIIWNKMF